MNPGRLRVLAVLAAVACAVATAPTTMTNDLESSRPWIFDHGGVIRADTSKKQLALIFTGGDFGEGTGQILDALKSRGIKASFFFTGAFLLLAFLDLAGFLSLVHPFSLKNSRTPVPSGNPFSNAFFPSAVTS